MPAPDAAPNCGSILIVDNESVTHAFTRILRREGYDVLTVTNGETGLREAEAPRPDAIICDLRMLLVDGLALSRRPRANDQQHETLVGLSRETH